MCLISSNGFRNNVLPVAWASQWLQIVVSLEAHRGQCTITLHTDAAGGEWSNFDDVELVRGEDRLSLLGADVSSLAKSEALGGVYYDEQAGSCNRHATALDILKDHGMNAIRLRVWVNSPDGYHNQAEIAEMARRCDARGLDLFIDLHHSDTWADPGQQSKPATWTSYTRHNWPMPSINRVVLDGSASSPAENIARGIRTRPVTLLSL
jgi:arabinogalactan endo-1,4-beta-galactosidase